MQVSSRNHKPHCLRTLNGSCEGGEGPLRLLPRLASPPGMSAARVPGPGGLGLRPPLLTTSLRRLPGEAERIGLSELNQLDQGLVQVGARPDG